MNNVILSEAKELACATFGDVEVLRFAQDDEKTVHALS
jgi:hypothetical protein